MTLLEDLEEVKSEVIDFTRIFCEIELPKAARQSEYLALSDGKYSLSEGKVTSSSGITFSPTEYKSHIKEKVKDYSTAKFGYLANDGGFMVGALARLSLHGSDKLNTEAKKIFQKYFNQGLSPQNHNAFNNIPAQAIELLHFLEIIEKTIKKLLETNISTSPAKITLPKPSKPVWGVGAIEAPRGTLYHAYEIGPDGKILNADIVTPTVQNLTNLEDDAENLLKTLQLDQRAENICVKELEMLIRAYDPCITCSVH